MHKHIPQLYTSYRHQSATEVSIVSAIKLHRSKHSAFWGCALLHYRQKQDTYMTGVTGGKATDGKVKIKGPVSLDCIGEKENTTA